MVLFITALASHKMWSVARKAVISLFSPLIHTLSLLPFLVTSSLTCQDTLTVSLVLSRPSLIPVCLSAIRLHRHHCVYFINRLHLLSGVGTSTSDPFKSRRSKGITNKKSVKQHIGIPHKACSQRDSRLLLTVFARQNRDLMCF